MTTETKQISIAGMGAIIHEGGVFFRVWAPHAEQVINPAFAFKKY